MRNIFHDGSSQKMQLTRDIAYTLSTDGYSLQKSGVSPVGRCSLKWSRSMQRRSKVVNKGATGVGSVLNMLDLTWLWGYAYRLISMNNGSDAKEKKVVHKICLS
ncbi:hypothetical protein GW17_00010705 [Ensete ventricosum]|nr:hypothetical protein GW17_00010705 [Ensete ventricosum]